jgi:hypothetical protein
VEQNKLDPWQVFFLDFWQQRPEPTLMEPLALLTNNGIVEKMLSSSLYFLNLRVKKLPKFLKSSQIDKYKYKCIKPLFKS